MATISAVSTVLVLTGSPLSSRTTLDALHSAAVPHHRDETIASLGVERIRAQDVALANALRAHNAG